MKKILFYCSKWMINKNVEFTILAVSLGFFDDICVPSHLLPTPSNFKPDPENE